MLQLEIPEIEFFDEVTETFSNIKGVTLRLEHSLVSISKWESKWKQPFLDTKAKTQAQTLDYIRCMTLNQQSIDDKVYKALTNSQLEEIVKYIETDQTATWFNEEGSRPPSREIVTSELIYYWMTAQNIPFECQKWHLSRLLTLVRICQIKNNPDQKKMSKSQILSRNKALNAARRKARASKG